MNARVTHFPESAYKIMPWKNGTGSTTELCIFPIDAAVQTGFDWRISLAQVPVSGPFSTFADYRRTIMLLRGDPMLLTHHEHGEHLLQPFQPYDFHGSWRTHGVLTGQPVEDFNVMIREGLGHAFVALHRASEKISCRLPKAPFQYVWATSGDATVRVLDQSHGLKEKESLLIEGGLNTIVEQGSAEGVVITVSLMIDSH